MVALMATSCAVDREDRTMEAAMDREKKVAGESVPSLTPPKTPDDQWSQWLVGEWESSAESDLGQFRNWVKGRGRMTAEMGLGGQFLILKMEGHATEISDEYLQYIRQTQHTSEEDIRRLQDLPFEHIEFQTVDPKTGEIVAYMFDSWRCVAKGTGKHEGNRQVLNWEWSVAGQGTSVRTTDRIGDDKLTMVERYAMPDGSTMEDRIQMTRKQ
jgi:hypothetical protein